MKKDNFSMIEARVKPLMKIWIEQDKSITPECFLEHPTDSGYQKDLKTLAVKELLTEYINDYAPDDECYEDMMRRLNIIFGEDQVSNSAFYVSYKMDYYLAHYYYLLMISMGDKHDLEYVLELIQKGGAV
jgi:hypothetical protein